MLAMLLLAPAQAQDEQQQSLDQAVQKVQQQIDGRILSADRMRSGRGSKYRIKVLTNEGRVRVIEVDSDPDKPIRALPDNKNSKEKH